MWPWEHLAFGYLLYSAATRATDGSPPTGPAVVLVALGTQAPDLIDKPLAWVFDLVPVAYAVGHSALSVVPVLVGVALLAARRAPDRVELVAAYAVGHLSHLVGDVIYPALMGRGLHVGRVLWPLVRLEPTEGRSGVLDHLVPFALRYLDQLHALEQGPLVVVQIGLVVGVFVVWLLDGAPGPRTVWRFMMAPFGE